MRPNLRSLVAKAYRVRQGRTFSSSSSSTPNPIDNKRKMAIYKGLLTRGLVTLSGYVAATYTIGHIAPRFDELVKEVNKDSVEFMEKRGKLPPGWKDSNSKS